MVMSTKEQMALEESLSCTSCGSLESIKEMLSRVDVRQVLVAPQYPWLLPYSLVVIAPALTSDSMPLSHWQAMCRNIEDRNQILLELEEGMGALECNRLVVRKMREALFSLTQAAQARQLDSLCLVMEGL